MLIPMDSLDEGLVGIFHLRFGIPLEELAYLQEPVRLNEHSHATLDEELAEVRALESTFKVNNKMDYTLYGMAQNKFRDNMRALSSTLLQQRLRTFQAYLSYVTDLRERLNE